MVTTFRSSKKFKKGSNAIDDWLGSKYGFHVKLWLWSEQTNWSWIGSRDAKFHIWKSCDCGHNFGQLKIIQSCDHSHD